MSDFTPEKVPSMGESIEPISPTHEFLATNPRVSKHDQYLSLYRQSLDEPDVFWRNESSELHWMKEFEAVHSEDKLQWFVGGKTNICFNCLDRHVIEGNGGKVAFHYETENGVSVEYTYDRLLSEVGRLSNCMSSKFGVEKGDRVIIYMPVRPENVIAMLACLRIGAIHSVVFGGFSAHQIAMRMTDTKPKLILTADATARRGTFVALKDVVDQAMADTWPLPTLTLNCHTGASFQMREGLDFDWHSTLSTMPEEHTCEALDSEDISFILYTSGSTGFPKGVKHSTGGYMLGAYTSCKYVFDMKDTDVYWCTADMGWITGHTYVAFGPLLMGATQVIYEGVFNHPDWNILFKMIEKHHVSTLYTAPTLIRALIDHSDPASFDLSSLRLLGSVGEPINTETWNWYFHKLGGGRCPIADTWWQTEMGCHGLAPIPGSSSLLPGCAGLPFFGFDPVIVDIKGDLVSQGTPGRLFIKTPWPSMLRGLWNQDDAAFQEKYFMNGWYSSGDIARQDALGNYHILGRFDDQLNVSGHRLGTAEIESGLMTHEGVSKVAVVPRPDHLTGQAIAAFVVLTPEYKKVHHKGLNGELISLLGKHINQEIGHHARPKYVYVVDNLPETKSGKTMRGLIRDIVDIVESHCDVESKLDHVKLKFSTLDKDNCADPDVINTLAQCVAVPST
eukprot:GHVH01008171.1.p1 GENE.GHVH01008171.1~~GHVH01008171.1.p1  ORF type:complete len:676 (+),score=82.77 GHVH01008171.1:90-2117(+)